VGLANKGMIIVIDGCRPDGLAEADTPHIDALWQNGAYTWQAQSVSPCVSLPPHCSLFWGVKPETHGITSNSWPENYAYKVPTIFDLCKEKGLRTAMVFGWQPFEPIPRPGTVDISDLDPHYLSDDVAAGTSAARIVRQANPDFFFVHLNQVDADGHAHDWMSDEYVAAIETADIAVGMVIEALREVGVFGETVIVVLADHGGHEQCLGEDIPEDMTIPLVISGPGIQAGRQVSREVTIHDTAPTVAHAMGLPIPPGWTGSIIEEAFTER